MDPNLNRNSMGSRAGTSIKPKFGAGNTVGTRQGTAGKVLLFFNAGIKSFRWSGLDCRSEGKTPNYRWRYQWTSRSIYPKKSLR